MKKKELHYDDMSENNLFVKIKKAEYTTRGLILDKHWHEQIQLFYFTQGNAIVRCNSKKFEVSSNDLVIINSKELHYIENNCDDLELYVIKIDLTFLYSNKLDAIQTQFLTPLSQNLILFKNMIKNDAAVLKCVDLIVAEYLNKKIGFEMAIKGQVYILIALLLRKHIEKNCAKNEFQNRREVLQRFREVIDYIDRNFTEQIDLRKLSGIAQISTGYFCRLFKEIAGISAVDYISALRINKAVELIKDSNQNMIEIAMNCGFNDSNYFSRVFKKYQKVSPTELRRQSQKKQEII